MQKIDLHAYLAWNYQHLQHGLFESCSLLSVLFFYLQYHWIFQQTCSGDSDWVAGNPATLQTSRWLRKGEFHSLVFPPRVLLLTIAMPIYYRPIHSRKGCIWAREESQRPSCSVVAWGITIVLGEVWGEMRWLLPTSPASRWVSGGGGEITEDWRRGL